MQQVNPPQSPAMSATAPLPPLVQGAPLIGNLREMSGFPMPFLVESYQRYGPIFRVRVLNRELTVIAGPEANQFQAEADGTLLRSRELWEGYAQEWNSPNMIGVLNGERHAWLRKAMKPGYARGVIMDRLPETAAIVAEHAGQLPVDTYFAVLPFLQRVVSDQLGMLIIGRRPGEYLDDVRRYVRFSLNTLVIKQWPRVVLLHPAYVRSKQRVAALARELVADQRANPTDARSPLVKDMIAAHDANPQKLTESDLFVAVMGPYIAGLDTVANTCTFLMHELMTHPDVYRRVQVEVDDYFASDMDPSGLKKLHALHGASMEALRKYPVGGINQRTATQEFTYGGYRVPSDQTVIIAGGVAHFLPELYRDPNTFDIERYQPPRNEHRQRGAFSPFSVGAHTCLGAGLAEVQIMLTVAALVHAVDLAPEPGFRPKIRTDPTITLGRSLRAKVQKVRHRPT